MSTTTPTAVGPFDARCHNAQSGSYGHECGRPATQLGSKPLDAAAAAAWRVPAGTRYRSGFCDRCAARGDERHEYTFTPWPATLHIDRR